MRRLVSRRCALSPALAAVLASWHRQTLCISRAILLVMALLTASPAALAEPQAQHVNSDHASASTADASAATAAAIPEPPAVAQDLLLDYLVDPSTFTLIDARSAEEYEQGHVAGALNVPHDKLSQRVDQLPADTQQPIVLYCKTGRRAGELKAELAQLGYENVQVLLPRQLFFHDNAVVFNCGI